MTMPGAAPPQLSPDGHWWWDGAQWQPASEAAKAQVAAQAQHVPAQAPAVLTATAPEPVATEADVTAVVPAQVSPTQAAPYGSVLPAQAPSGGRGSKRLPALAAGLVAVVAAGAAGAFFLLGGEEDVAAPAPTRTSTQARAAETPVEKATQALGEADMFQKSYWSLETRFTTRISDLRSEGLLPTPGVRLTIVSAGAHAYCHKATVAGQTFYQTADTGPSRRPCR